MKRLLFAAVLAVFFSGVCLAGEKPELADENDRVSYSVGYQIGGDFKRQGVDLNPEKLVKGIQDARSGAELLMTRQEMHQALVDLKKKIMAEERKQRREEAEKVRKEGEAFLAANRKKEGVVTLGSGLQYRVIQEGAGKSPKATDNVTVNYRGTLVDGTEFDSSYKRGQTVTFPVNGVIPGWTEALQKMKEGDKWQLFVPSSLAYGERGAGREIGPNATLLFEVELIAVK